MTCQDFFDYLMPKSVSFASKLLLSINYSNFLKLLLLLLLLFLLLIIIMIMIIISPKQTDTEEKIKSTWEDQENFLKLSPSAEISSKE